MARQQELALIPDLALARGLSFRGARGHRLTVESVELKPQQWTLRLRLSGPLGWEYDPKKHCLEATDSQGRIVRLHQPALRGKPLLATPADAASWLGAAPLAPLPRWPWAALALHAGGHQRMEWSGEIRRSLPYALNGPIRLRLFRFDRLRAVVPFELRDLPLP
jgi:hypothetical protein